MGTFYTGTTLECLYLIKQSGEIKIKPPKRVWEEESGNYVYLIPADSDKEEGEPFYYCVEQSSFAVSALNGSKRVILEIQGIDESKLEKDPDGAAIGAVAYPNDIPISHIKNVFIETEDNSVKIKELIAITNFVQRKKYSCLELEYLYLANEMDEESVFKTIDIPNIKLVPIQYLINEEELSCRYCNLIEEIDRGICLEKTLITDIII